MVDTGTIWRGAERERLRPLLERCEAMLSESGGWDDGQCIEGCNGFMEHDEGCAFAVLLADLRKELGR